MNNSLWEDLINGKYNLTLFAILGIFVFHLYYKLDCGKETMADSDINPQIREAVKQLYAADVESIKNLSEVATKLQKDGLTIPGNLDVKGTFNYLPKGIIVAWSGSTAPAGWALCDGQNGTPDLRGRFVRMFSDNLEGEQGINNSVILKPIVSSFPNKEILGTSRTNQKSSIFKLKLNEQGGTDHQVLDLNEMPAHTHLMDSAGQHSHIYQVGDGGYPRSGWKASIITDRVHQNKATDQAGQHTHNLKNTGSGLGHNNIPPFYVLAYIIKL